MVGSGEGLNVGLEAVEGFGVDGADTGTTLGDLVGLRFKRAVTGAPRLTVPVKLR